MNWGLSTGFGPFRIGLSQTGRRLMLSGGAKVGKFRPSGRIELAPAILAAAQVFMGNLRAAVANAVNPSPVVEAPSKPARKVAARVIKKS
jgi:hypothetical protein